MKEVDFNTLRRLHLVVATLAWLTATGRLLSAWLMESPDWETLDGKSLQSWRNTAETSSHIFSLMIIIISDKSYPSPDNFVIVFYDQQVD